MVHPHERFAIFICRRIREANATGEVLGFVGASVALVRELQKRNRIRLVVSLKAKLKQKFLVSKSDFLRAIERTHQRQQISAQRAVISISECDIERWGVNTCGFGAGIRRPLGGGNL